MKIKLLLLFIFYSFIANAQSEFTKNFDFNSTNCKFPDSERARQIYPLGIASLEYKSYSGVALQIFSEMIEIDSTFCDAYYWAGYTMRQENYNREAVTMYYLADSLSQKPSLEFKQNLATVSMMIGLDSLSRAKYTEITKYFPESPEGYYGIALTSTIIGDIDYGLENIIIADEKYYSLNKDAQLLHGILLTLNEKHEESLPYYKKVKGKFSREDNFNGNYAMSLYKVAILNDDKKMMKKAKKHYGKIKDKSAVSDYMRELFEK